MTHLHYKAASGPAACETHADWRGADTGDVDCKPCIEKASQTYWDPQWTVTTV